jgi:hypothetical protein
VPRDTPCIPHHNGHRPRTGQRVPRSGDRRRRLDGASLSATVKTRKSTATRWKPCAKWPRNRATPASVAVSRYATMSARWQGPAHNSCCNAWIALRRIWLSLRHGCMAEKHSSHLCKNSCDGG